MTWWYVNSAASGSGAGTSWTNACTSLVQLMGLGSPPQSGDSVAVLYTSNESHASNPNLTNWQSPLTFYSCDNTNSPPQASDLRSGAAITTTGNTDMKIGWGELTFVGFVFNGGTGGSNGNIILDSSYGGGAVFEMLFVNCAFNLVNTSGGSMITDSANFAGGGRTVLVNPTFSFGATGQCFAPSCSDWEIRDTTGNLITGSVFPTTLIQPSQSSQTNTNSNTIFNNVNFTNYTSGTLLSDTRDLGFSKTYFRDCTIPSGPTLYGNSWNGSGTGKGFVQFLNCGTSPGTENFLLNGPAGTIQLSTGVNNGASDGTISWSYQYVSSAHASLQDPLGEQAGPEIEIWVPAGTYTNTKINVTSATAGLTNADLSFDVRASGSVASTAPATFLTSSTALSAGSAWSTPLTGTPTNYLVTLPSFTVAAAGYIRILPKLAKASATVYIDPNITVQ